MNQSKFRFSPLIASERIDTPDVIREMAIPGILMMNINGMGLPFACFDV